MIYEIDTERIAADMVRWKKQGFTLHDALMIEILAYPPLREALIEPWSLERKQDK